MLRPVLAAALVAVLASSSGGCALVRRAGIGLFYRKASVPENRVVRDVAYLPDGLPKHRLNLFLPTDTSATPAAGWPVVVFVHGGGWTTGDRDYRFGSADLYNNVGRFLARRGIGVAVVSYRLQPSVGWRAQVEDAAAAVVWTRGHIARYGGDPVRLFLMGHSAGSHLATFVALDRAVQARAGIPAHAVCGVVPVSGAGLVQTDRASMVNDFDYFANRFAPRAVYRIHAATPMPEQPYAWQREASPALLARADAPPFLVLRATHESKPLRRQSLLLDSLLRASGATSRLVDFPARSHELGVPALSRADRVAGPAAADFVLSTPCRR